MCRRQQLQNNWAIRTARCASSFCGGSGCGCSFEENLLQLHKALLVSSPLLISQNILSLQWGQHLPHPVVNIRSESRSAVLWSATSLISDVDNKLDEELAFSTAQLGKHTERTRILFQKMYKTWSVILIHYLQTFIMIVCNLSWIIIIYHTLSWFVTIYHICQDLSWSIMIYDEYGYKNERNLVSCQIGAQCETRGYCPIAHWLCMVIKAFVSDRRGVFTLLLVGIDHNSMSVVCLGIQ